MSREQGMADISPKEVSQPESGKSNPSREEHILHPKLSGPMRAAVVGSIAAGLAGGCVPPNGNTETPESSNTPPTVEFSPTPTGPNQTPTPFEMYTETVTPTGTQTQEPTKTETATPTEAPRYQELLPATQEECRTDNVIRFGHENEDWAEARRVQDEFLKTLNVTGGVERKATGGLSGYQFTLLEFDSKIASCFFLELNDMHEGVHIFGTPFISPYDNQAHWYNAAFDLDNYDEIVSTVVGSQYLQDYRFDYSRIVSQNYNKIQVASMLMFTYDWDYPLSGNPLLSKLEQIYSQDKGELSAKIANPNWNDNFPNFIKELNDDIFPCAFIIFQ